MYNRLYALENRLDSKSRITLDIAASAIRKQRHVNQEKDNSRRQTSEVRKELTIA